MIRLAEDPLIAASAFSSQVLSHSVELDAGARWYALYTRGRHEKLVHRELQKKRIETFLPLRIHKRHWSDRVKIVEEPLFKSYLFFHIPIQQKLAVLNTVGAVSLVGARNRAPVPLPDPEIEALRRFVQEEVAMDPFPYLKEGRRVCIRSGPFKGIQGFVVRKNQQCRLVISLDMLMQSVSVELDSSEIEPV